MTPGSCDHILHINTEPLLSIELTLLLIFLLYLEDRFGYVAVTGVVDVDISRINEEISKSSLSELWLTHHNCRFTIKLY